MAEMDNFMSDGLGDVRAQIREQIDKLNTWFLISDSETITGDSLREADISPELDAYLSKYSGRDQKTIEELRAMLVRANQESGVPAAQLREKLHALESELEAPVSESAAEAPADSGTQIAEDPALIADFVIEAREHLAAVENNLLTLENDPTNAECLNAIFRSFHSIKGLAAFLEFHRVQRFAHEVETLLDAARNKAVLINAEGIDLILACTDFLNRCIAAVEGRSLDQVPKREEELVPRLQNFHAMRAAEKPAAPAQAEPQPAAEAAARASQPAVSESQPAPSEAKPAPAPAEAKPRESAAGGGNNVTAAERYSVRVDTSKLDYLMDMVGELVITESLIKTELHTESHLSNSLTRNLAQLARLTGEVQRTTLNMRMVPVGQLFRRMARMVRDLARKFSKQVDLQLIGEETEVDKTIAEELADPLMHMVRNALDHGVENVEGRRAAGKSEQASLILRAYHQSGQVCIEVEDDGRGMDRKKILAKAQERGLSCAESMSDSEVFGLIFAPGFSTAEVVTDVSGRGVGMDVVRRQVEKLNGKVDVESKLGKGSKFVLRLPLTRAIIEGLLVSIGPLRCIVPLASVKEVLRPTKEALPTIMEKGEMAIVHDRLLPIVRLHRRFNIEPKYQHPYEAVLIVCEAAGRNLCLMVDQLDGKQEVVIKNLGAAMKDTHDVAGGAILGDGRVGLILDVEAIGGATPNV